MIDLALNRRSIRRFSEKVVDESLLQKVLDVALLAPSSWGKHPVEFVVIKNQETIKKLARCKRMGAGPISDAPVVIAVIVDRSHCELWVEDGSVASAFLLLAAEQYGLGACWVQMRDRDGQRKTAEAEIQDILDIPHYYGVLNLIAIGHKGETKKARTEKDIQRQNVHLEMFS